jgi:tripartite-type tricarboxylate transporter receptor subunit TctC
MRRRHLLQAASAAAVLPRLAIAQATSASSGQAYPAKPIRYIVPVAAGGGNDMIARVVTARWGALLGQTFRCRAPSPKPWGMRRRAPATSEAKATHEP